MRTTVTLDKDLAVLLKRVARRREVPLTQVLNEALRRGLEALVRPPSDVEPYQVRPWHLGASLVGSLDNVEEVLSRVEGEDHR